MLIHPGIFADWFRPLLDEAILSSGDTSSRECCKLLKLRHLQRALWIRIVLVRGSDNRSRSELPLR